MQISAIADKQFEFTKKIMQYLWVIKKRKNYENMFVHLWFLTLQRIFRAVYVIILFETNPCRTQLRTKSIWKIRANKVLMTSSQWFKSSSFSIHINRSLWKGGPICISNNLRDQSMYLRIDFFLSSTGTVQELTVYANKS